MTSWTLANHHHICKSRAQNMPPRKRVNSERDVSQTVSQTDLPEHSHKKRRLDPTDTALALTRSPLPGSIKMDQNSAPKPLRRSARLQHSVPQAETPATVLTNSPPKKQQRSRSKTLPSKSKDPKVIKRKPTVAEKANTSPKRRRRKSTSAKREEVSSLLPPINFEDEESDEESEVRDSDGVLWIKMPIVNPQDIYDFAAEFYIAPPRTVEVNADVGPPPIIVRLHIVDKKTGQEVPYDNDRERYYWVTANILHEDNTPAAQFTNHAQSSETPMSWFHEEQEEDTRTPVTQTPPPGGPVRKWKTFVTFPNIQIPEVGKYRIKITFGIFIDQKLRTSDGREKTERVHKNLVATTSDIITVQEEEPKDDDEDQTAELLEKKGLYDKLLAERDEFFKRQDESF
ncbi:hypothetical protein H072_4757 [Dactylellina haptotyla CBS 200.50]|uniref:Velvet domain-containing protein n=1 Tax=Dactylellina haptotyla (strain CBS 200.50) TaxID=1284197 RepID=S8AEL6_DACHA|nr:hypothetical protein H072_4757 [Dactylellina haptotyla CBS 200.50]